MISLKCYLCGSEYSHKRPGTVRDDPSIDVLECDGCGLVYLSSQGHIGTGHYEKSGMHGGKQPDIDAWIKDTVVDDERRFAFLKQRLKGVKIIDFGCGVGGFLERAVEVADTAIGIEPELALQEYFQSRKQLQVFCDCDELFESDENWDVITAFHVIEHLSDPIKILSELATLLSGDGELIIEVPNADDALLTLYDCSEFQDFTYWSQHLYLFNTATLGELSRQAGLKVRWLLHLQRFPLSNHLYWLAKGKPGGHEHWHFLNNDSLVKAYEMQLAALGKTDTIIAGLVK